MTARIRWTDAERLTFLHNLAQVRLKAGFDRQIDAIGIAMKMLPADRQRGYKTNPDMCSWAWRESTPLMAKPAADKLTPRQDVQQDLDAAIAGALLERTDDDGDFKFELRQPEPAPAPKPPAVALTTAVETFAATLAAQVQAQLQASLESMVGELATLAFESFQTKVAAHIQAGATPATDRPTAPKPKRPMVLVVGLRDRDATPIVEEFKDVLDVRCCTVDDDYKRIKALAHNAACTFLMTGFVNHSHQEAVRSASNAMQYVNGGVSALKDSLTAFYANA